MEETLPPEPGTVPDPTLGVDEDWPSEPPEDDHKQDEPTEVNDEEETE